MFKILTLPKLILLNQYVQGVANREDIFPWYSSLDENSKQIIVKEIWILATQAKVLEDDLITATAEAGLKPTHNSVQMLKINKMPFHRRGYELANLKGTVLDQAFLLVLECFVLAERRRKELEEPDKCTHWWHKDLSDKNVIRKF
ncbi:DUF5958 family protein [Acetonema longum]|uniref:Uncharacterized protein n=1 Tax=Acetonema longum DSM 6540 TaxID=1009370 RepID=F7NJF7_9FIRM|nr:DUF5958 family protein [Acetonema longum]EGO63826.1 hypothetical protein ALO_11064 [Acetonema longum DSM 6540]